MMDTIKIGNFLAGLRKEQGLTQEALGEKLGVTNKTISRWENGNYLPPVEMLQELSKLYAVSINELLCGERIEQENYQEKAEETITGILSGSPFSFQERSSFWKRKWQKEHFLGFLLPFRCLKTVPQLIPAMSEPVFPVTGAVLPYKKVSVSMPEKNTEPPK